MAPNHLQKRAFELFQAIKYLKNSSSCSNEELQKVEQTLGCIQSVRTINSKRMPEMYRITKNILKQIKS